MRPRLIVAALGIAACLGASALAQQPPAPVEPQLGQKGKDVQWIPSPAPLIEKMLDMAAVTPRDYLVDLGSGDGVTVIAAAKRGVRAMGIEYDANLVAVSKRNAQAAGVSRLTRFVRGDIFKTDFSRATVVTTFLLPSLNLQLRPTILAMKPGTRVVSNTFPMGEWEPDDTAIIDAPCERWCKALFWIVPARVGGTWRTAKGDLTLTQKFQVVTGTLGKAEISGGRLRGDAISFTAGGATFTGRVDDYRMTGTVVADGVSSQWNAVRRSGP
ncbi:MAG TPA: methyltransferase domain-containing protein [Vicinamibacterales bacterium]|nr:methyltransferase domain-containing protein [Vicinamibacterales bacterium]